MSDDSRWVPFEVSISAVRDSGSSTFVRLFGSLTLHPYFDPETHEEDLYFIFASRAEMMGWSATWDTRGFKPLWGMNDAGLQSQASESAPVAWFQVGISQSAHGDVFSEIPPLVRCAGDAVQRIGVLSLAGLQVSHPTRGPGNNVAAQLISGCNWFNVADDGAASPVRVTIAAERELPLVTAALQSTLEQLNTGPFVFESAEFTQASPAENESLSVGLISPVDSGRIVLDATVPEWSLDALGWVIAMVHGAWSWIGAPPALLVVRVDRQ